MLIKYDYRNNQHLIPFYGEGGIMYATKQLDANTIMICSESNDHFMYLAKGNQKAALIDTGWGEQNVREFAEGLTDLPLIVLITHCHVDHVGGCGYFEEVYMGEEGPFDLAVMRPNPFVDTSKLPYPDFKKKFLHDGDIIDLGGRSLYVIETKAHAVSGLMFWDRDNKYLFCGDEVMAKQVMILKHEAADPVWTERIPPHLKTMERLLKELPEDTLLLPGHNISPIDMSYVQAFKELDDKILSGKYKDDLPLANPMLEKRTDAKFKRTGSGKASFIFQL